MTIQNSITSKTDPKTFFRSAIKFMSQPKSRKGAEPIGADAEGDRRPGNRPAEREEP